MVSSAQVRLLRDPGGFLRADLPGLILELIEAGGSNLIPAPSRFPDPSPADAFEALAIAARSFELSPGVALADHFWDHAGDLRRGAVAERLRATVERRGQHLPGFLAIYATSVRSPLAYGPQRMPLRVAESIDASGDIGGPYLVLISCRLLRDGKAEAVHGYAQPILSGRRFVPVFSNLERDIFEGLIGLQTALDAHGVDCTLKRALPVSPSSAGHDIHISIGREGTVIRELRIAIGAGDTGDKQADARDPSIHVVKSETWGNGQFISWLEQAILA